MHFGQVACQIGAELGSQDAWNEDRQVLEQQKHLYFDLEAAPW